MKRVNVALLLSLSCMVGAPLFAQGQIGGGNCSPSLLNGSYSLTLAGRAVSASGTFSGSFQSNGTAAFDGLSKVTFTLTVNTNLALGKPLTYAGTYSVPSNCSGTITITTGTSAAFSVVVWNAGANFNLAGADGTYSYNGNGSRPPAACATATLSGAYTYTANGFNLSGTNVMGTGDEAGVLQFDGQGNVSDRYTIASGGMSTDNTATGTYTVTPGCLGSATLADSTGKSTTLNFTINNPVATSFDVLASNSTFVRTGGAHSTFLNPSQSIGNVASYAVSATPPGSVFVIFGANLASRVAGAVTPTLPTTLLSTTVMVNGELVPLFYVDPDQIDAQMPWDIPGGAIATVVVKNGTATSNAAAIVVPSTGTPGISVYGNNRAVVVNADGSVNSPSAAAKVGDEVVAYFTGGGPVQPSGKIVTGAPAPVGLSPVTADSSVTLNNASAKIAYIGLTPGSIGLYQVNFFVPQVARGTYPLVITIAGQKSNSPVMTVN
jgi:uncharacterized protein (TIGR03437 family)